MPPSRHHLNTFIISLFILSELSSTISYFVNNLHYRPDASLNFTELSAKYGYGSEEHTVVTEDGFLLTIFRMKSRKCEGVKRYPPVVLEHGLFLSSDAWLDAGPEAGLAYLLADECYDLWVGNQRGNYYGRRHQHLHPDTDIQFWDWSVDEIGLYDIPATIDYVLIHTGATKLNYIGYSQGCGTFFIMCSERPGYCDKVNLQISIAPATRHLNTKSVGFRGLNVVFEKLQGVLTRSGIYEALPNGGAVQKTAERICSNEFAYSFCVALVAFFDGFDPGSFKPRTVQSLSGHFPAGTSVKNLARYGQAMRSVDFVKYDYGASKNLELYGSVRPPLYNFSAVTVPVVIIGGNNDGVTDKEDVKYVARNLPNVKEFYEVKNPLWTHFDNAYSQYIPVRIFKIINKYLSLYSHE